METEIPKQKEVMQLLKTEISASEIQGRLGINYYKLLQWLEEKINSKEIITVKKGKRRYYKLNGK